MPAALETIRLTRLSGDSIPPAILATIRLSRNQPLANSQVGVIPHPAVPSSAHTSRDGTGDSMRVSLPALFSTSLSARANAREQAATSDLINPNMPNERGTNRGIRP